MAKLINLLTVQDITTQLTDVKNPPIPSQEGFIAAKISSLLHLRPSHPKQIRLTGHLRPITAVTLSAAQDFLISCSTDKVILWRNEALNTSVQGGDPVCGTTIGVHLGPINQCSISCNNEWLALSKPNEIWIVHLKWGSTGGLGEVEHHSVLRSVTLLGSSSSFSPDDPDFLVAVEDSNVFKLWNVRRSQLLHQASIIGSHRISFCAFSSTWPSLLVVGSNRGGIHVFRLKSPDETNLSLPRLLFALDLARSPNTSTVTTADSETSRSESGRRMQDVEENAADAGCIILNAILVRSTDAPETSIQDDGVPNGFNNDDSTLRSILKPGPVLITCSNQGIAVYSVNPAECVCSFSLGELSVGNIEAPIPCLDYAVLSGSTTERVDCVLRALGGKQSFFFTFKVQSKQTANTAISMLASNPVSSKSPLRVQMRACAVSSTCSLYSANTNHLTKQSKPRRKVQSSGYGLPPRQLNFTPRINGPVPPNKSSSQMIQPNKDKVVTARASKFLMLDQDSEHLKSWRPPLKLESKIFLQEQYGAALHLGISGDGDQLACSSKELITVFNANRINLEECISLIGHDSRVNSVSFSLDNAWLVSASDDGSSKVWDWKNKRCVLEIPSKPVRDNKPSGSKANKEAICVVSQASFYYMDHFLVQAVGSHLDLCCHRLHEDGPHVSRSTWRLVRRIHLPAQKVTCFSAANRFHSNYLVAGSSNRSLLLYDVDAETLVLNISSAHVRAPHTMCALTGSSEIAQPARILDLLLSSAICDGVKLWDLRTAQCVQKYSRHYNRAHLSGIDVSPCCRYVAVASEDKCVYLYDSRRCHDYLCKLSGFTVPVMDVVFSPCKAQLFAAALNGSLLSFSDDKK